MCFHNPIPTFATTSSYLCHGVEILPKTAILLPQGIILPSQVLHLCSAGLQLALQAGHLPLVGATPPLHLGKL